MSNDFVIMEVKDAARTHTIQGAALDAVLKRANQQGKSAEYIIHFADVDITLTGTLTRGIN
jgi:hypothetical protein